VFRRRGTPTTPEHHGRARLEAVGDANFEALTSGRPTVIDLWAPWCAPCRSFRPILEAVAATWGRAVRFGTCNVDESPNTAMLLQVRSIPTIVAFGVDGSEVGRLVGVPSRARLEAFVSDLVAAGDRSG
jgi:thioredoxin